MLFKSGVTFVVKARSRRALIRRILERTRDHLTPMTSMIMKPETVL